MAAAKAHKVDEYTTEFRLDRGEGDVIIRPQKGCGYPNVEIRITSYQMEQLLRRLKDKEEDNWEDLSDI